MSTTFIHSPSLTRSKQYVCDEASRLSLTRGSAEREGGERRREGEEANISVFMLLQLRLRRPTNYATRRATDRPRPPRGALYFQVPLGSRRSDDGGGGRRKSGELDSDM